VEPPHTKEKPKAMSTPKTIKLERHVESVRAWADAMAADRDRWISRNRFFYDEDLRTMRFLIPEGATVLDLGCGSGFLLAGLKPARGVGVDISPKMLAVARHNYPDLTFVEGNIEDPGVLESLDGPFDYVVLSDTLGHLNDIQEALTRLHAVCGPRTRVVIAYHSHLWEPVLTLGERIGQRMPGRELNWLDAHDVRTFLGLAGFEALNKEWKQLLPKRLLGLGTLVNRLIAPLPLIRHLCLRHYVVARPAAGSPGARAAESRSLSASVLIPCRNERGNIEPAVRRLPRFCDDLEIVFVEGHSEDGTWEEIQRVQDAYPDRAIKAVKQPGKGKGDAMRAAYAAATKDVLIILDADLTVPPEDIPKFYDAIASNMGEFINGTRLVYAMEGEAMRFLNYWANRTFAALFSYLLNQTFTDTLCGTKVMTRRSYDAIAANRHYFGDFDPFGDFDLIFGAAKLSLKVVEVPIRYADREYGETQISRFRHGWMLLRMVAFAFRRLKMV
jgi:SAM-dependent methyltransferase